MEIYTSKDFASDYGHSTGLFNLLVRNAKIKPIRTHPNDPSEYNKADLKDILKTYDIKKEIKNHPEKYYSVRNFRKDYPYEDGMFQALTKKYQPVGEIKKCPHYLKTEIQPVLDALNQKMDLKNNYVSVKDLNRPLGLKTSQLVDRLKRNNIPILRTKNVNDKNGRNFVKKDIAKQIIKKYHNDRNEYPISYNQALQKLESTSEIFNIAIKLADVTPHRLYLGTQELYFSNNEIQNIKTKLKYANGTQIKNISKKETNNEKCDIRVVDFCRMHNFRPDNIRNAVIRNNKPYYKGDSQWVYISKSTADWILKNHINNKPDTYLSITELANQNNIERKKFRRITDILIHNNLMDAPHHYINSSITYLDPDQQQKILNYYQNQYKSQKQHKPIINHLKINTNKAFDAKKDISCKTVANSVGLKDPQYPIRWAKLGQVEYKYDGKTIYFTKQQAANIKKAYRNYPIEPTQLVTKSKVMEIVNTTHTDTFTRACKELNIPIYNVLGDRRLLINKDDIEKIKRYYKKF